VSLTEGRVAEIVDRHAARTQGPYQWEMSTKGHEVSLESRRNVVIDFVRWGMTGAAPCFLVDGVLVKADTLAVQRQKHHIGFDLDIDHPDAQGIAHSWQDVDDLLKDRLALLFTIEEQNKRLEKADRFSEAVKTAFYDIFESNGSPDELDSERNLRKALQEYLGVPLCRRCLDFHTRGKCPTKAALSAKEAGGLVHR
jgi:hypothetical protein